MSIQALDLLVESELLKSNGSVVDIYKLPDEELSRRFSYYANARRACMVMEIERHPTDMKLNAQFSTWSSKFSKENTLSSLLIYNSVVLDDPLISSEKLISIDDLYQGLVFFSWLHPLIKSNLVTVYPISFYGRPNNTIPLLSSEDAFRSSISSEIHDYAHGSVLIKSVIRDDQGRMLVLNEDASLNRRTALNIEFKDDQLYSGVGLFLFQTTENIREGDGKTLVYDQVWDKDGVLPKEKFERWAYQATNQAIIARLKAICNQTELAQNLGHTYITESKFESVLLSLSHSKNAEQISPCVKFFNINNEFVSIESPSLLLQLREKHTGAFDRFNLSLLSVSEELHGTQPEAFERKCKALFEKDIMPQVDEIRNAIGQISSGFVKGTLSSFCGVGLAVSTGSVAPLVPSLLLSAAQGLSETLPAVRQLQLMKKKPAYIWHRLVKV